MDKARKKKKKGHQECHAKFEFSKKGRKCNEKVFEKYRKAERKCDADARNTDTETGSNTDSDSSSKTDTDSSSKTDTDSSSKTDTESDTDTDSNSSSNSNKHPGYDTTCGNIAFDKRMNKFNQVHLDAHNKYRALHHSNPLAYDHDLANKATNYALQMDQHGWSYNSNAKKEKGQGENKFVMYKDIDNTSRATDRWYE